MAKEIPVGPDVITALIDGLVDLDDGPAAEGIHESDVQHQAERDRMIVGDKIRATDRDFEERKYARNAAVRDHIKKQAATGNADDFVEPPAEHEPAPKAASGFVVQSTKRRGTKLP